MDYGALLYSPVYAVLGVPALLTPVDGEPGILVTAIDKTSGIEVAGAFDVLTIKPAAAIRVRELAALGVALADLDESPLSLNGRLWRVRSHMLKPSPRGELEGEVFLILSDEDA
ncbi:MAG: hypothetical protein Q8M31_20165 [Beijerinckiaceae bacterium]|nr:hypothetical protein [Beijerinckiaceae bacterium]